MGMASYCFKSETTASNTVILEDWGTVCTYYIGGSNEYSKVNPDQEAIANPIQGQPKESEVCHVTKRETFDKIESDESHQALSVMIEVLQLASTYG